MPSREGHSDEMMRNDGGGGGWLLPMPRDCRFPFFPILSSCHRPAQSPWLFSIWLLACLSRGGVMMNRADCVWFPCSRLIASGASCILFPMP